MEKFSVKLLDVLYYDNKLIPVRIETVDDKKVINFVLKNTKAEIDKFILDVDTYNKGASGILTFKSYEELRYAEIGSLLSAICNYGFNLNKSFPVFAKIRRELKKPTDLQQKSSKLVEKYFDSELTEAEVKTLFAELNKERKNLSETTTNK